MSGDGNQEESAGQSDAAATKTRRKRFKLIFYSGLLFLVAAAYAFTHYGLIPGLDPYFFDRQTIDAQIVEEDGRRYLWGGDGPGERFDITEFRLDPGRLEYALGRERIPALIDPQFTSVERADAWLHEDGRVLVAKVGSDVKIYPVRILKDHEAVNDTLGGRPILAAYCLLAELGAIYDRSYGDTTYTFGVSGYTYYDWKTWRGRSAFVLWDRETESLWWPPIGKAVSGPSVDVPMKVLEKDLWAQTIWSKARALYPDALVLDMNQHFEKPVDWPPSEPASIDRVKGRAPKSAIAPHWGKNARL